jgi:hypothetical protein
VPEIQALLPTAPKAVVVPFDHFFDLDFFTATLSDACPQMHIYRHVNELYDLPSTSPKVPIAPLALHRQAAADRTTIDTSNWRARFYNEVNRTHPVPPSVAKPILVALTQPLVEFPISAVEGLFVANFGRLLRFRADTRRIAAAVLYALSRKHALRFNFNEGQFVLTSTFYGAHLPNATTLVVTGRTEFDVQQQNYARHALAANLPIMYVALDDPQDRTQLPESNRTLAIETKESLLGGPVLPGAQPTAAPGFEREWSEMQALSLAQQFLIDYEVLLRAGLFGGTWYSDLSWNVAMRRHVVARGAVGRIGIKRGVAALPADDADDKAVPRPVSSAGAFTIPFTNADWRYDSTPPPGWRRVLVAVTDAMVRRGRRDTGAVAVTVTPRGKAPDREQPGAMEKSFEDPLSVVFGPAGEGKAIMATMWP